MSLTLITDLLPLRLAANPAFITIQTNMAAQENIRIDLAVIHKLWDNSTEIIGTDSLTPGDDGKCTFEISEYLTDPIIPAFTFPATKQVKKQADASARFQLQFTEYYGAPPVANTTLLTEDYYYAAKGKIPDYFHHLFYNTYTSFNAKLLAGDMRLSFEHLRAVAENKAFQRKVNKSDTLKIFVQLPADPAAPGILRIRMDFTFTDGTSETEVFHPQSLAATKEGNVVEFDAGYNTLELQAIVDSNFPGKTVHSYTITPYDGYTTALATPHEFIIDETYYPHRREFLFLNAMGAYDTFIATGEAETDVQYDYEIASIPYWPQNLSPGPAFLKNLFTETRETISANTGFITRDQLEWLPELFASTQAYEILNGKLIPIVFEPGSIQRKKDKNGLHQVNFEYRQVPDLETEETDPPPPPPPPEVGDLYGGGIVASVDEVKILILALEYPGLAANWDQGTAAAAAYEAGGFTNWRLPTRDELLTIRMNIFLSHNEAANLDDYYHWTNADDGTGAWARSMNPNDELFSLKNSAYYYRPVRLEAI